MTKFLALLIGPSGCRCGPMRIGLSSVIGTLCRRLAFCPRVVIHDFSWLLWLGIEDRMGFSFLLWDFMDSMLRY